VRVNAGPKECELAPRGGYDARSSVRVNATRTGVSWNHVMMWTLYRAGERKPEGV
jgi:hypothetical protein